MMSKLILNLPKLEKKQAWGQLPGCSLSLALAEFCETHSGIKLLVTPDNLNANQLLEELSFFFQSDNLEILLFPDWEILPYDQSAHRSG